jgi:hypothetical protein
VSCCWICQVPSGCLHARPDMFCVVPSISAVPLTMRHVGDTADVVVVSFNGSAGPGCDAIGVAHATQLQSTIPSPIKFRMNPSCSTVRYHDADLRVDTVKTPSVRLAERVAGACEFACEDVHGDADLLNIKRVAG